MFDEKFEKTINPVFDSFGYKYSTNYINLGEANIGLTIDCISEKDIRGRFVFTQDTASCDVHVGDNSSTYNQIVCNNTAKRVIFLMQTIRQIEIMGGAEWLRNL